MKRKPQPAPARTPVAYGYTRVSTAKQGESGLSVAANREEIGRYYKLRLEPEGVLWGDVFVDDERRLAGGHRKKGVSGKTRFIDRPAGRELLLRLLPGDHVVFSRLDRGFRSFRDAIDTIEGWIAKGVHIHLVKQAVDTSHEGGRLFLRMMAAFAEFERAMAAERTREALRHRKRRGGVANQYPGYGRRLEGVRGHRRVADDPAEQKVIAAIVEMHESRGLTFDQIFLCLLKANIRTRSDRAWSRARIYRAYLSWKSRSASSASTPATTAGPPSVTASPTTP